MTKFICINDLGACRTLVINIDQIVWYDANISTIMTVKGPIVTDSQSMKELIGRIDRLADKEILVQMV